ncbi:MAG: hypothetical protein KDI37_14850, partial [Xanthomonadales bacterium]|nr:hypothetical protein [Xanthomonadales bacterium]
MTADLERQVLDKTWFYRFELPSGAETRRYEDGAFDAIHDTRLRMLDGALAQAFPQGHADKRAVDLACHQGYFSLQLAQRGFAEVVAVDARADHIADVEL